MSPSDFSAGFFFSLSVEMSSVEVFVASVSLLSSSDTLLLLISVCFSLITSSLEVEASLLLSVRASYSNVVIDL